MDDYFRFPCPNCGKRLKALPVHVGRIAHCGCGTSVRVPSPIANIVNDSAALLHQLKTPTTRSAAVGFDDRVIGVLRSCRTLPRFSIVPDIPEDDVTKARNAATVPPEERILGLVECSYTYSGHYCLKYYLLFGCRGIYSYGGQPEQTGFLAYQEFPGTRLADWDNYSPVTIGRGLSISAETQLANKAILQLFQPLRQLCLDHAEEVPDERARVAEAKSREEKDLRDQLSRIAQSHLPGRTIRLVGVACDSRVIQSAGAAVASFLAGAALYAATDIGVKFQLGACAALDVDLVVVTRKNLYVIGLGTISSEQFSLDALEQLKPPEMPDGAALSQLTARCSGDDNARRLTLEGDLEYELIFPHLTGKFVSDNATVALHIADAIREA